MEMLTDWKKSSAKVFWAEIAPTEHLVQIYENDEKFLELLLGFVSAGIASKECAIVIATSLHLTSLNEKLTLQGFNVDQVIQAGYYLPMDAEDALSKFMVNGWPDENLFNHLVGNLISRPKNEGRSVRAFGEMVAILWSKGHVGATVRLEQLWNKFCEKEAFCLFCAYPQSGFAQDASESLGHICNAHSKMITSGEIGMNDIFYKPVEKRKVLQQTVGQ
jgi:hypothetical protein